MRPEVLEAAAIFKALVYAGAAANFYRKFEDGARLAAMEWYLRTADTLLARNPDYSELHQALQALLAGADAFAGVRRYKGEWPEAVLKSSQVGAFLPTVTNIMPGHHWSNTNLCPQL